ncbi:hypothetical protein JCM6882_001875 [Rhodosporidiobolus microsporus]
MSAQLAQSALRLARTRAGARNLTSTARRFDANSHPNLSTQTGGDVKPTAWADRKVQAKGAQPIYAWFAVLGALGAGAYWKFFMHDTEEKANYRGGTLAPSESHPNATGRPASPPTYAEKK